ncbi:MAG: hypothetical protein ACRED5_04960 [Propylenella sp.]
MSERWRTSGRAGLLFAAFVAALGLSAQTLAQDTSVVSGASQAIQARTTAPISPTAAPMVPGAHALTAAERARVAYWSLRLPLRGPDPRRAAGPLAPPAPSTATVVDGPKPMALGTLQLRQDVSILPAIPAGRSSSNNEPSVAMSGRNRFQTGNWYAAFSNNGGTAWQHLSPFTTFPAIDGGFCCNQDVIHDPSRNVFFWVLQYGKSGSTADSTGGIRLVRFNEGSNSFTIASWTNTYVLHPSDFGGPATGEWFDDPHLAIGQDYLYLAINVFTTTTDTWARSIFARFPLDQTAFGAAVVLGYINSPNRFNFTPVQGAKEVMYWATHVSGSLIQILRWPENSNIVTAFNRNVHAWLTGGVHNCPGPDGNNWCGSADNRIIAGALGRKGLTRQHELWFFWNVREGGGFPLPYIDAARFRESDLAYVKRPFIWSPTTAYHYIGAAPNQRGDLGISVAFGSTDTHVSSMVCAEDDFSIDPPGWTSCLTVRTGAHGPASQHWGDFLRVRPAHPADNNWVATGFTLQSGPGTGNTEPRHIVFGRQRDAFEFHRWYTR